VTPEEERIAWIRAGFETDFSVWSPDVHDEGPDLYYVVDAECDEVARCSSRETAEILVRALKMYDRAMWRIDPPDETTA
jgi:hypothetical protein